MRASGLGSAEGGGRISRRGALRAAGLAGGAAALALAMRPRGAVLAQQAPTGPTSQAELTRLAEDLFIWRNAGYLMMVYVTDEGVITTDPSGQFNPKGPGLTKAVVASITDKPVKYVVYSHDHADHATGGAVFADTAQFVGHRLSAPKFAARGDAGTPTPTVLVDDAMKLELGGKTVELSYAGRNHSDNMLVMNFPARRVLYAVDFIPVRAVQFRALPDAYPDEWIESFRKVEAMDFDTLVPGHPGGGGAQWGSKDVVREQREYMTDLMKAVSAARGKGFADKSTEMVDAVRADLSPKYGTGLQFGPGLSENIDGLITAGFTGV
ncbi:MAG: MBL fold metallo-hydrolase [Dehalococcoidia bacterium]